MTEQSVIRILLLAVLVWHLAVCWSLIVRDWPGWEHLRRWKKPKRRKRRPKPYKKLKPFEELTQKPVCPVLFGLFPSTSDLSASGWVITYLKQRNDGRRVL